MCDFSTPYKWFSASKPCAAAGAAAPAGRPRPPRRRAFLLGRAPLALHAPFIVMVARKFFVLKDDCQKSGKFHTIFIFALPPAAFIFALPFSASAEIFYFLLQFFGQRVILSLRRNFIFCSQTATLAIGVSYFPFVGEIASQQCGILNAGVPYWSVLIFCPQTGGTET